MAGEDDNTNAGAPPDPTFGGRLEIGLGAGRVTTADYQGDEANLKDGTSDGLGLDLSDEGVKQTGIEANRKESGEEKEEPTDDATASEDAEKPKAEKAELDGAEGEGEVEAELPALPTFEAGNEEVVASYDERYLKADPDGGDGKVINLEAFTPELEANLKDGKATINEDSYAYLKAKFGISRDAVDMHIKQVIADSAEKDKVFFNHVGGVEAWNSQAKWASENYTPAQKAAFNKAMRAGGQDAVDQLDLLKSRFERGGGKIEKVAEEPAKKEKRPASPQKSASGGTASGGPAAQPYADQKEYRVALGAAGEDEAKRREVNRRLNASPWFKAARK